MDIHALIKSGLPLASDAGSDIIVVLDDETGDLVAYVGNEGDYEEHDRAEMEDDVEDMDEVIGTAEQFLDELVNVDGEGKIIEGEAEDA